MTEFFIFGFGMWIGWLVRGRRQQTAAQLAATPSVEHPGYAVLQMFGALVDKWSKAGQLGSNFAQQIHDLLGQEALQTSALVDMSQYPAMAQAYVPLAPQAVANTPPAVPPIVPQHTVVAAPMALVPRVPTGPSRLQRMATAVLALRTRQLLLFLGAFLLLSSSLILVVFNWASFPAILQFLLLAGVCAGLWGGGAWVARQPGMARAGLGLEGAGSVLLPVVAYALSRPHLLDLAPRSGWLLASVLSLPIYGLAAWRRRHVLFVTAGCLAGLSAALAAADFASPRWMLLIGMPIGMLYVWLAERLRQQAHPELAVAPFWLAQVVVPIVLVAGLLMYVGAQLSLLWLAMIVWLAVGFYLLAAMLAQRGGRQTMAAVWLLVASILLPVAAVTNLLAAQVATIMYGVSLGALALGYLTAGLFLERRVVRYAVVVYIGAVGLMGVALLLAGLDFATARWTLPLLIAAGGVLLAATRFGSFAWLGARRIDGGVLGLVMMGVLLPGWLFTLGRWEGLGVAAMGRVLLPLAAGYLVLAWRAGRYQRAYDYTLQALGVLLALCTAAVTWYDQGIVVSGMFMLSAVWLLQALLQRRAAWAALMLGTLPLAVGLFLVHRNVGTSSVLWTGLAFTAVYTLGATSLRQSRWKYWTVPGLGWGLLAGALLVLVIGLQSTFGSMTFLEFAILMILTGLVALLAGLWKAAGLGLLVAGLAILTSVLGATHGFFIGSHPDALDPALVLCGLAIAGTALGQLLRRWALIKPTKATFGWPYEVSAFGLLLVAPWFGTGQAAHVAVSWTIVALMLGLDTFLYRLPPLMTLALLAGDMAVLARGSWLHPGGRSADAAPVLLVVAWLQGLLGLWQQRRQMAVQAPSTPVTAKVALALRIWQGIRATKLAQACYVAVAVTGGWALLLAIGAPQLLMTVAFGLAVLLALIASVTRWEAAAWGALGLAALGFGALHDMLLLTAIWSTAWGVSEAFGVYLVGWAVTRLRGTTVWQRPLAYAPPIIAAALGAVVGLRALSSGDVLPLTFTLATLGLLMATVAVRERKIRWGYGAGAAFVAAGLSYLFYLGFRDVQWYVIPAGLYLLLLAHPMRAFQGGQRVSQIAEAGAAMLMLGPTLVQAVSNSDLVGLAYTVALCAEAGLFLGYGTLLKLRVPFASGAIFFVLGVLWMSVDPVRAANKWVLLGALGLLLVGVYILLERWQEQLARAGRLWVERISGWQ